MRKERLMEVVQRLLEAREPAIRYRARTAVLGEDPNCPSLRKLQGQVGMCPRVRALLSERTPEGEIPYHPYSKWYGAHWVLSALTELGHPAGDESLLPLREQVYAWLLSPDHIRGVRVIRGRARRCASQEGNALWAMLKLGLEDDRAERLAENLLKWQWPDGGWNCDDRPEAVNSSFHESLIPLRALALYGRLRGSEEALQAARRAADVFLKRKLFRRQRDGSVMNKRFLLLHYPCYWRYDILFGLKVMAEAGFIADPRCAEALDLLESKRLGDGGFPAEERLYHTQPGKTASGRWRTGRSLVDWGGVSKRRMKEFVTADALYVLGAAGRGNSG